MKKIIISIIILGLLLASCKKDDCPEPEKPIMEKCAGCSPQTKPIIDVKP